MNNSYTYNDVNVWYGVSAEAGAFKGDAICVVDSVKSINGATEQTVMWLA